MSRKPRKRTPEERYDAAASKAFGWELVEPKVSFLCPWCGGKCAAGAIREVQEATVEELQNELAILHSMPPCERYVLQDADEFLEKCRQEIERMKAAGERPAIVLPVNHPDTNPIPGFTIRKIPSDNN